MRCVIVSVYPPPYTHSTTIHTHLHTHPNHPPTNDHSKRNEDAYQMLRSLCLTDTEEGFDFHLELHHTVRAYVPGFCLSIYVHVRTYGA